MEHTWGRFVDLRPLGEGGLGVVYRAYDPIAKREVALKALRAGGQATPAQVERLRREALALARLQHRYLLPVYGLERSEGGAFVLVGPLVPGEDLEARLERLGPLPALEAATLVRKIAEGVAHAHEAEILHRDIKPANVLLSHDTPEPLLADFGIARIGGEGQSLTQTGQLIGTPSYMAPEQGMGEPVEEAADVYGLGGLLFSCLTAAPPRTPPSLIALLDEFAQGQEPPAPSALPDSTADASLDAICRRALAHDPAQRYPSALALVAALQRYEAGERLGGSRSRGVALAAAALVLTGLLATSATLVARRHTAPPSAVPEEGATATPLQSAEVAASRETWLQRIARREARSDQFGVLAAAQELLRQDPRDLEAGFWEARALTELARYPEARAVLERSLRLHPEAAILVYQRGDTHENSIPEVGREVGEPKALADYGRAIELGLPHRWEREARISRAGLLRDARRWELAEADYRWLATNDPRAPQHLGNLGYISTQRGRPQEALAYFDAALELDPNQAGVLLSRSTSYREAGRHAEALVDLRRVLQRESELEPPQAAQARYQLAGIHYDRGEVELAIESARESVRHARKQVELTDRSRYWIVLAAIVRAEGRAREALEVFQDFLTLTPDHLPVLRLSYDLSLELGDRAASASIAELAREHHPESYETDLMAAELLVKKRPAEALKHCERALQASLPLADAFRLRVLCAKLYFGASRTREALGTLGPLVAHLDSTDLETRLEVLALHAGGFDQLGEKDAAQGYARLFLEAAPANDPRRAAAQALLED